jgi:hypothetical protein
MKKLIALLLCLLLTVPTLAVAEEKVVNILSWEGYIDEDTLYNFEQETGIKVIWSPMDSIDSMLLKVAQGGGADYDLILSSDYSLDILRQEGLLQKLEETEKALAERQLRMVRVGTLAEAMVEVNHVMEAAQAAADQYLENIAAMEAETKVRCEELLRSAQKEAQQILDNVWKA